MAADQRKRRLNSASTSCSYGFQEPYKAKKRDLRSPKYDFNFNNHVSLKWDENGKRVVAKDDQIGISYRHLAPSASCNNTKLADVVAVPTGVFELNDLSQVLSYEVWQLVLTDKERNFLAQFLPPGVEVDEVVHALLSGDNFCFGNPSFKWGLSLCSGGLHPDAIIQHEKSFKKNKKVYYLELQQYHDSMIRSLQNLKQTCASSNDPEAKMRQIISRPKRHGQTILHISLKLVENVAAVFESCSPTVDAKLYYNDNQKRSVIGDTKIQKRMRNQGLLKEKHEESITPCNGLKVLPRSKKAEKVQKLNPIPSDGAKYMSYVKVSKKQLDIVKNMRQSGSKSQSRDLKCLLGNLDSSNVKPYELFVEEEKKRINVYWLSLANKDIPTAFKNWRNLQSVKRQMMDVLLVELEEKLSVHSKAEDLINPYDDEPIPVHDEDNTETFLDIVEDHLNAGAATLDSISDNDEEESDPISLKNESPLQNYPSNIDKKIDPPSSMEIPSLQHPTVGVGENIDPFSSMETQSSPSRPLNVGEEFIPASSMENKSSMDNCVINGNGDFTPMDLNAENNAGISVTSNTCYLPGQHDAHASEAFHSISYSPNAQEIPGSSLQNMWSPMGAPGSYHAPTTLRATHGALSLRHLQAVADQSGVPEKDTTKDLLNRRSSQMPFYDHYPPHRDGNELLQSLIKRENFHQQLNKPASEFHPTNALLEPANQFPSYFQEPLLQPPFASDHHIQKAPSKLFMHQNIQNNIYSDNNRYSIQGPEHFPSLNVRELSNARLSNPIPHPQLSSGELLTPTWFPSQNRAHVGCSLPDGMVFSAPIIGSNSGSDQSLYSGLPQCNLLSQRPYNPMVPTQQMIPPTNYGQLVGGMPINSNGLLPPLPTFNYLRGVEASSTMKTSNMGYMSLGHQSSGLRDPSGKPRYGHNVGNPS